MNDQLKYHGKKKTIFVRQMLSLEMEKVQLRMRIFELRFEFDQKELLFYAQVGATVTVTALFP